MDREPPQYYIDKPIFQGQHNGLINCNVDKCDWSYAGPRFTMRNAWNEHYRMNHSQQVGIARITKNLRERFWLPTV